MDLKKFHVDENKVWFTGGYWPEGVPHQFYEIEDIEDRYIFFYGNRIIKQISSEETQYWQQKTHAKLKHKIDWTLKYLN